MALQQGLRTTLGSQGGGAPADCTSPFAGTGAYVALKRPTDVYHWPCVAVGVLEPSYFFECQEASGNLTDSVSGLVLGAVGSVGYSASVTDWTTAGSPLWVTTTSETANQGFYVDKDGTPLTGWNVGTQSVFIVGYSYATSCTAERIGFVMSGTTAQSVYWAMTAAGVLRVYCGTTANATGAVVYENATPTPFAWAMQWDRRSTGLTRLTSKKLGTGAETITPASWATKPDGGKGINVDVGSIPFIGGHNMVAVWVGTDAETMMDRGGANTGGATIISELGW